MIGHAPTCRTCTGFWLQPNLTNRNRTDTLVSPWFVDVLYVNTFMSTVIMDQGPQQRPRGGVVHSNLIGGWRWTESEEKSSPTKNVPMPFPNCSRSKAQKKNKSTKKQLQTPKIPMTDSICSTAIISSWSLTLKLLMFQQLIFVIQIQAPVGSGETRLKTKCRSMCHRPIDLPNPKLHHLRSIPRPSYAFSWGGNTSNFLTSRKKRVLPPENTFACGDWWKFRFYTVYHVNQKEVMRYELWDDWGKENCSDGRIRKSHTNWCRALKFS